MNAQQEKEILQCRNPEERMKRIIRYAGVDLYKIIRPVVKTHQATDDVLQETLVKIHLHLNKFQAKSKLSTWMYRIALNEALQWKRKHMKFHAVNDAEYDEYLKNLLQSDPWFAGGQAEILLEQAMEKLPEKQALVFRLKYFKDMKYSEISEITGLAVGTLKTHYHLAVKKIKSFIQEKAED